MLITLVIIGVVAALTIPNLMQKYTEQTTVKKVQKFYSTLSNAYNLAMKDNGTVDEWGITGNDEESAAKIAEMLFKPYFKIAKDCGNTNKGGCLSENAYKRLDNTSGVAYAILSSAYKFTLEDGAAIFFGANIATEPYIGITYDVNGPAEPNQFGKDTFEFVIRGQYVFPSGLPYGNYHWRSFGNGGCVGTNPSGFGCAAWVIYKGNMDYLHCDGLKWTSKSCKEK